MQTVHVALIILMRSFSSEESIYFLFLLPPERVINIDLEARAYFNEDRRPINILSKDHGKPNPGTSIVIAWPPSTPSSRCHRLSFPLPPPPPPPCLIFPSLSFPSPGLRSSARGSLCSQGGAAGGIDPGPSWSSAMLAQVPETFTVADIYRSN